MRMRVCSTFLYYMFNEGVGLGIGSRGDWGRCEKTGIPDVRYWMVPNEHKSRVGDAGIWKKELFP